MSFVALMLFVQIKFFSAAQQTNILCNTADWSPLSNDGGTWTFYNNSQNSISNCSVVLTNAENLRPRLWFGSANGTTYNSNYDFESFILRMEVTMNTFYSSPSYGEFAIYYRLTEWGSAYNVGSGYGLFLQTWSGGRQWIRLITSGGATVISDYNYYPMSLNVKYSVEITVNQDHLDSYTVTLNNDTILGNNLNFSSYGLNSGSIGFWSYGSDLTIHSITLEDTTPTSEPSNIPTKYPTISPSILPTQPSNIPSILPSSQPSDYPSSNPSNIPSSGPSSNPSGSPSSNPSNYPTDRPSNDATAPTDGITTTQDESSITNKNNNSSVLKNESVVIVLIISSFCACSLISIAGMLLICFYWDRKERYRQQDEQQMQTIHNVKNKNNQSNIQMGTLQNVESNRAVPTIVYKNDNNNSNNNSSNIKVNNGELGDSGISNDLLDALDAAVNQPQPQIKTTLNQTNGTDILMGNDDDDVDAEGMYQDGAGDGEINHTGFVAVGGIKNLNNGDGNNDRNDLSQKEVVLLVREHLRKNGFDEDIIANFLKEFTTKNVTGRDLVQFKKSPKLLDTFKMQFSKPNQILSIWLTINIIVDEFNPQKR